MKYLYKKITCSLLCIFILIAGVFYNILPDKLVYAQEYDLEVHFVDVGQGDCIIIQLPDGKTMIVDAGDNKNKTEEKILSYIQQNFDGLKYFDYCIVTHTDADHLGSMPEVLEVYPAMTIYRPNVIASLSGFVDPVLAITQDNTITDQNLKLWDDDGIDIEVESKSTVVYKEFIEQAYKSFEIDGKSYTPKVLVSDGRRYNRPQSKPSQDINGDNYLISFYSPLSYQYSDSNNYSNIFIIEYKGFEFFLSGDAEKEAEAAFVETYKNEEFDIDVYKLGHHGSRTSSSSALIELVTKQSKRSQIYGVISCGEGNSYGHPHTEVLDRFLEMGFSQDKLLRTDTMGDIVFEVKKQNGVYNLYYKDSIIPGDTKEFDFFDEVKKFINSIFENMPENAFYIIGVVIIAVIILIVIIIINNQQKSKNNKK